MNLPPPPPYPGHGPTASRPGHARNHSDTSGQSECSGGSAVSGQSGGRAAGWYETELDSSSDTLTPARTQASHTSPHLTSHASSHLANHHPQLASHAPSQLAAQSPATPARPGPLLPFSITPPRPAGPSQAEMKIEALTAQLEEEMEKKAEEEFFGQCSTCSDRVTGSGQACQVVTLLHMTQPQFTRVM